MYVFLAFSVQGCSRLPTCLWSCPAGPASRIPSQALASQTRSPIHPTVRGTLVSKRQSVSCSPEPNCYKAQAEILNSLIPALNALNPELL